jgi:NAD(P)-dependent dehydrogenase (short-subunit alcohol dehydrogenase family)
LSDPPEGAIAAAHVAAISARRIGVATAPTRYSTASLAQPRGNAVHSDITGKKILEILMTLDGKRIVVLGGSSGIGLATAKAAAKEGASVVIASSRRARIDDALAKLPVGTEGHVLDLANETAVQALFASLGGFDHLVFTAGETLQLGSLTSTDVEAARRFFGLRYWGAYLAAKYGSGSIRPGGSIVFTSGLAGKRPHVGGRWGRASAPLWRG